MRLNFRRLLASSVAAAAIVGLVATPALAALGTPDSQSVFAQPGVDLPITLTVNDPGSPSTFEVTSGPAHGGVLPLTGSMTCDGTKCSAVVTYTASSLYEGADSFDFTVSDTEPATSPPATVSITVDGTAPSVQAFTSAVSSPTKSTSIAYTLTFDGPVTGIDAGDFENGGSATGCSFAPSAGAGTSVTITVTSCSAPGTLTPRLLANSVADLAGNAGPTAVSDATTTLTLDRLAPTATLALQAASDSGRLSTDHLTNAASLVYDLTFSESVTGLAADDFTLTGGTGCSVGTPVGAGSTYTVTLTGCSEGSVTLGLTANSVQDLAANSGPAGPAAAAPVTIDRIAPTLTLAAVTASPTSSTSLGFSVTAAENLDCGTLSTVAGVDFTLTNISAIGSITGSGTPTCAIPATSSIVAGSTGTSSLTRASTFALADDAGNAQTALGGSPASVTVDRVAPTATLDLQAASDSGRLSTDNLTNAASLVYDLTFSEPVTGLAANDFTLTGAGCSLAPAGSGSTYTVTLTGCSEGSVGLDLTANAVQDVAANTGPASLIPAATVTIDRTAPTLTLAAVTASPTSSTSLAFRITAAGTLDCGTVSTTAGVDFTHTNITSLGSVSGTGTPTCSIPATSSVVPGSTGTSTLTRAASFALADEAGNAQTALAGSPASITVTPTNLPPVAHNDVGMSVPQNATAFALAVLANDTDPDAGTVLRITTTTSPAHGKVAVTGGGSGLTYTPNATYRGSDSFTYTISDGTASSSAAVVLTVVKAGAVTRLSGLDRYATSAAISKANFTAGVPVAYIASGLGFADALSGAPVAGIKGGPILLVATNAIPASIKTELTRLKPANIVILGGPGVVSSAVAGSLKTYTTGTVIRLAGADRYATSATISRNNFAPGVPVAYIASGLGFADALSGAPVAAIKGGPILLVTPTAIPATIKAELTRLKPAKIVILGGTGVVSTTVATQLKAYSPSVSRLAGLDRYATSATISKNSFAAHVPVAYIASGLGFADALSGAPVAGIKGGPILLVTPTAIPAPIVAELIRLKPANIVILGGTGVVSASVAALLAFYTTGP